MSTTPTRAVREEPARGATALGAASHPRHVVGSVLRAVRVFGETAFSVVVLGRSDAQPTTLPVPRPRRQHRDAAA